MSAQGLGSGAGAPAASTSGSGVYRAAGAGAEDMGSPNGGGDGSFIMAPEPISAVRPANVKVVANAEATRAHAPAPAHGSQTYK